MNHNPINQNKREIATRASSVNFHLFNFEQGRRETYIFLDLPSPSDGVHVEGTKYDEPHCHRCSMNRAS